MSPAGSLRATVLCAALCVSGAFNMRAGGAKPQDAAKKDTVHLDIYYETLCPYCEMLLDGTFRQIWEAEDFRKRITVSLVPFGNAMVIPEERISAGYHFFHPDAKYPVVICQHHDPECLGNEIQTCVSHLIGMEASVPFVLCMANHSAQGQGVEMSSYNCMEQFSLDKNKIKACVGSDDNIQRIVAHGQKSTRKELNRSYVPWVTADDEHVEMDDDHDLITPLCGMLTPPLPKLCSQQQAKEAVAVKMAAIGSEIFAEGPFFRDVDSTVSARVGKTQRPATESRCWAGKDMPSIP